MSPIRSVHLLESSGTDRTYGTYRTHGTYGATGAIGPTGPTGPTGPAGTGNMWIVRQGATAVVLNNAEVQVLSLTVPAGTYAISAKVSVSNADAAPQTAIALWAQAPLETSVK